MKLTGWVGAGAMVVLAACRGDAPRDEASKPPGDTLSVQKLDSIRQHQVAANAGGISGDTVGPGFKVTAEFTQDTLMISPAEIPPGEVTIYAQNKTQEVHRLEIVGQYGGRWRTLRIPPGGGVSLNSTMVAGPYDARDPDSKDKRFRSKIVVK
jgi:hypothetical protein